MVNNWHKKMKKILLTTLMTVVFGVCNIAAQNITATYGSRNHIEYYGRAEGWTYKLESNGTIIKHNWKCRDSQGLNKIAGSDTYVYGTYTITNSTTEKKTIKIRWSNGKEENAFIIYPYRDGRSELRFPTSYGYKFYPEAR